MQLQLTQCSLGVRVRGSQVESGSAVQVSAAAVVVVLLPPVRDTLLHGQPMRRPSIKSMDIPHGMREVVEQECNTSQVSERVR
jgi:hypothetical protein